MYSRKNILIWLFILLSSVAIAEVNFSLSVSPESITVGDTIEIGVHFDSGVIGLRYIDLTLDDGGDSIDYNLSASVSNGLFESGLVVATQVDEEGNMLYREIGSDPISGDNLFVTLEAEALLPGEINLNFLSSIAYQTFPYTSETTNNEGITFTILEAACDDADADGACDDDDICEGFDDSIDTDSDGTPDGCDSCPNDNDNDSDGDGVCGDVDQCEGFDDSIDTDSDGTPDGCDSCPNDADNDLDGDGVCGDVDPCPEDSPDDTDADGICNVDDICEGFDDGADVDSDGTPDGCDTCPDDPTDSCGDDPALTGDLDNSGSVDSADAIAFTTAFKIGAPHGDADLDDNGSVNWDDIKEFLQAYLG